MARKAVQCPQCGKFVALQEKRVLRQGGFLGFGRKTMTTELYKCSSCPDEVIEIRTSGV